jgi:hypothetical protein
MKTEGQPRINWRERFFAFSIHFAATLALAAIAAALIFFLWFPHPFETMIGGTELFMLVVGCDLALGPLLSLVIYNTQKSRFKLVFDYTVVGVVQLAAMVYGVLIVAGTRPVYVAFNKDRLEVVTARDIEDSELAAARDPRYSRLPWNGPRLVYVDVPREDQQDALLQSVAGREEHQRPKFFAPYEQGLAAILKRARPVSRITKKFPDTAPRFDAAMAELRDIPPERIAALPVRHRNGFWTALIDTETGMPVAYVPVDPYGD